LRILLKCLLPPFTRGKEAFNLSNHETCEPSACKGGEISSTKLVNMIFSILEIIEMVFFVLEEFFKQFL
jgi:hypothetical protein